MLGPSITLPLQNAPATAPTGAEVAPVTSASTTGVPDAGAATPSIFGNQLLMIVPILAIFYFVLIGPERKNRKKREEMLKQVKKGDKVMTTGGMLASVAAVAEDEITLQVADGVRVRFARSAIQSVTPDEAPADPKKN